MARKNPYSKDYRVPQLCRAIEASLEMLEKFRWERLEVVRKAAGNHYGDEGGQGSTAELRFINWLAQYRTVVARQLVAKNPRCLISTFEPDARPICATLETWANEHFERIYLGETLLRIAYDALDCVGIAMVALADPADAALNNYEQQAGEPFIKRIDIEDFVFDHRAKSFREATFLGHHFRCPVEVANDLYMRGKKEKLEAQPARDINPQGDDRVGVFSYGRNVESEEYEEYVSLWNIYLPKDNVILTLRSTNDGLPDHDEEPLRVQRWIGPPCGPYHFLGFCPIPGSAMPKAPTLDIVDLDDLLNMSVRKLADQAGQQKTFIASSGSNTADGERARVVHDGDVVDFDDVDSIKEIRLGGPDQVNFAFAMKTMDWLNRQSGNLDTMAGLTQGASTARQEAMLNENSSRTVMDMMDASLTFTESVMKAYLWLHYHHPFQELKAPYQVRGYSHVSIMRRVTPEQRYAIDWNDIGIKVDPYAKQHQTPEQKMAMINSVVDRLAQREQFLAAQGIMLDVDKYLDLMSKYMDTPEIADLYSFSAPPNMQQQMMGGGMPEQAPGGMMEEQMGSSNPSEATPGGENAALIQKLMGGNAGGNPEASPELMATQ